MRNIIQLEDILEDVNTHYVGGCFYVDIGNKEYSFVKGFLGSPPRHFQHPLFHVKLDKPGCYLIRDMKTGKVYIGSSGKLYKRVTRHKQFVLLRRHDNPNFTEVLKKSTMVDFEVVIFFTQYRDEAYELEQFFINRYKPMCLLINTAHDARYAMRGIVLSEEHRKKISVSNTGRAMSEETKLRLSASRKVSVKAQAQLESIRVFRRKPLLLNGVLYESVSDAVRRTEIPESRVYKELRKSGGKNKDGPYVLNYVKSF